MEYVSTNNAPGAIGPYSQAVKANGLLFTSGQIAINPETNMVEAKTIEEQTHQVCKNLKAVVEAAGTSMEKVVKTVCFLADINDFAKFNEFTVLISLQSLLVHALQLRICLKVFFAKLKLSLNYNF